MVKMPLVVKLMLGRLWIGGGAVGDVADVSLIAGTRASVVTCFNGSTFGGVVAEVVVGCDCDADGCEVVGGCGS